MRKIVVPAVLAAGIALAPMAHADGTDPNLTAAVGALYVPYQTKCTPNMHPQYMGVELEGNGKGRVLDATPGLGGEFEYFHLPAGSPGTPGYLYRRWDAPDGTIYFVQFDFC